MNEATQSPPLVEAEIVKEKKPYVNVAQRRQDQLDRSLLPNGLTQAQETFCKGYVKYGHRGAKKALLEAGYSVGKKGVEGDTGYWDMKVRALLKNPKIKKRIGELEKTVQLVEDLSREAYVTKCLKLHDDAKQAGDFKAAKDALELIGRAMDYLVDKRITGSITADMNKPQATKEERMARIAQLQALIKVPK